MKFNGSQGFGFRSVCSRFSVNTGLEGGKGKGCVVCVFCFHVRPVFRLSRRTEEGV